MQHTVQSAVLHELTDHDQIWRIVCTAQHRQYVRMREYSQLWKFVHKRIRRSSDHALARILAQIDEFRHNLAIHPDSFERVSRRCGRDLLFQL